MKFILDLHKEWLKDHRKGKRADLTGVDLRGANLRDADLRYADLRGADLRDANLLNLIGDGKRIRTIQTGEYTVNIVDEIVCIGCRAYTWGEWLAFTDEDIINMDGERGLSFWKEYKSKIMAFI